MPKRFRRVFDARTYSLHDDLESARVIVTLRGHGGRDPSFVRVEIEGSRELREIPWTDPGPPATEAMPFIQRDVPRRFRVTVEEIDAEDDL